MMKKGKLTDRHSGIELLKIIACFMIVVNHVTQTLCGETIYYAPDYVINIDQASTSVQHFFLILFSFMGAQGNLIFLLVQHFSS